MKTLREYLQALSVNNLMTFGLERTKAESFIVDLHNYGLLAFEKLPAPVQNEMLYSYTWIHRPVDIQTPNA